MGAKKTGDSAQQAAHNDRNADRNESHSQRDPCAVNHTAENIPTELVGAEPMGCAGSAVRLAQISFIVGKRRDHIRKNGAEHQDQQDEQSRRRQAVPDETLPGFPGEAVFFRFHCAPPYVYWDLIFGSR